MPLSSSDRVLFQTELDKARIRLVDQQAAVSSVETIIASEIALPSLKAIARKRLPKLLLTRDQTFSCVAELEAALNADQLPLFEQPVKLGSELQKSKTPRS